MRVRSRRAGSGRAAFRLLAHPPAPLCNPAGSARRTRRRCPGRGGTTARAEERKDIDAVLADAADSLASPAAADLPTSTAERAAGEMVLGRYRIERKLGEGTSGTTYAAEDTEGGARVAVKELALGRLKTWKQFELFKREAATLRELSHAAVPRYVDYREEGGCFFLVQELADGPTLQAFRAGGARVDDAEVARIARALLDVLRYLSSRRPPVIHRDIKPENIVLEGGAAGGRVRLVDFGGVQGALATADAAALGSTVIGTAGYMPPEQFGGAATPASDLYALGAVLLFLLSGRPPSSFPNERLRVAWERDVDVSGPLRTLLSGLLEPIAEDRITAAQALDILDGKDVELPKQARAREATASAPSTSGRNVAVAPYGMVGRLPRPWREAPEVPPAGSRLQVSREAGQLCIDTPPAGTSAALGTGVFAVAWNAFVGFWTVGALAGGGVLFALFSLPFWFAGATMVRTTLLEALMRESVTLGQGGWVVKQELARLQGGAARFVGNGLRSSSGDLADVRGAKVKVVGFLEGEPRTVVELQTSQEVATLGEALSIDEQEFLAAEINRHLQREGQTVTTENDVALPSNLPYDAVINDSFDVMGNRPGGRAFRRNRLMDSWDD